MEARTDEQLIEAINAGDSDAFGELYARYRDWVLRLAWRHCGNHAEALDVLQDTFAYLLGRFPGFRLTARMTTFLYPVVKHIAADVRRRRMPGIAMTPGSAEDRPIELQLHDESESDAKALRAAVSGLPDGQREVLLMRFVDDMSLADISEAIDVPLGTVKSRLHHALAALRDNPNLRRHFDPG